MVDFNEDLLLETKSPLFTMLTATNFEQHVTKATTDQQSLLDHIYRYTNLPTNLVNTDVADSYYADHDLTLLKSHLKIFISELLSLFTHHKKYFIEVTGSITK